MIPSPALLLNLWLAVYVLQGGAPWLPAIAVGWYALGCVVSALRNWRSSGPVIEDGEFLARVQRVSSGGDSHHD